MDDCLNGIQNNPERDSAATPARPVSDGPGLACVPRIGRVPGASLSGVSLSGGRMRRGWKSAPAACGAALWLVTLSTAAPAALLCDEYNPFGPVRTGEITLDAADFADEDGTEILSFIETESIGKVDVQIVSTTPAKIVRTVSAVPEISTASPYYGERLKGIKVAVSLTKAKQPVSIVLKLRQVCAKHFRNTFLYY
jgi:hypothetical protein